MTLSVLGRQSGLLGGVAALALFAASPASTAELEFGLGAQFEQYFGYVSYDGATSSDYDGVDAVAAGQLFLQPMATLDNGLQFGANIEIEGHVGERNAGAQVDEASLFFKGSFGEILLGKSDTPGNHMQFGAPVGFGPEVNFSGLSSASLPSMLQFSNVHNSVRVGDDLLRGTLGSTLVSNMGKNTGARLSYFTPRLAGFQLGASYAPDGPNSALNRQEFFDLGASYTNNFNVIEVGASAKWGRADDRADPTANPEYWGLGLNLGYGDFALGGSYAESSGSSLGHTDGQAFDLGATYHRGRYGVSLNYLNGENIDDENAALGTKEQLQAITLAASFSLTGIPERSIEPPRPGAGYDSRYGLQQGMGAMVFGYVSYTDFSEDIGDGGAGTPGDDVDGFVIGTGIRLTF